MSALQVADCNVAHPCWIIGWCSEKSRLRLLIRTEHQLLHLHECVVLLLHIMMHFIGTLTVRLIVPNFRLGSVSQTNEMVRTKAVSAFVSK